MLYSQLTETQKVSRIFMQMSEKSKYHVLDVPDPRLYDLPFLSLSLYAVLHRAAWRNFQLSESCRTLEKSGKQIGAYGMRPDGFFRIADTYIKNSGIFNDSKTIKKYMDILQEAGILETLWIGMPARRWVRLHPDRLLEIRKSLKDNDLDIDTEDDEGMGKNGVSTMGKNPNEQTEKIPMNNGKNSHLIPLSINTLILKNKYSSQGASSDLESSEVSSEIEAEKFHLLHWVGSFLPFKTQLPKDNHTPPTKKVEKILTALQKLKEGKYWGTYAWNQPWLTQISAKPKNTDTAHPSWESVKELLLPPLQQLKQDLLDGKPVFKGEDLEWFFCGQIKDGTYKSNLLQYLSSGSALNRQNDVNDTMEALGPEIARIMKPVLEIQLLSMSAPWAPQQILRFWKSIQNFKQWYDENLDTLRLVNYDSNFDSFAGTFPRLLQTYVGWAEEAFGEAQIFTPDFLDPVRDGTRWGRFRAAMESDSYEFSLHTDEDTVAEAKAHRNGAESRQLDKTVHAYMDKIRRRDVMSDFERPTGEAWVLAVADALDAEKSQKTKALCLGELERLAADPENPHRSLSQKCLEESKSMYPNLPSLPSWRKHTSSWEASAPEGE
jgi:hypothetical protein